MLYLTQKLFDDLIENQNKMQESIYQNNLDRYTLRKTRKTTLGEWTDVEEKEYLAQIEKCKKLIAELPESIPADVVILSDEEYDKMVKEQEEKRAREEAKRIEAERLEAERIEAEQKAMEGEIEDVRNEQESEQIF